jgi:hypothetical protein
MKAPRAPASLPHDEQAGADSVARFAEKHGISRSMAYEEIANGCLVARKVGARTIITSEDAAKWRRALPKAKANGPRRVVTPAAVRDATRARTAAPDRAPRRKGDKHGPGTAPADDPDGAGSARRRAATQP